MTAPNDGTQPPQELAQPGTPATTELAQQQAAPAANPTGQSAVQPNPELAALQAELAAAREEKARFEKQFKDTQAAYTQTRQQLSAVVGAQPQADPLAPYVDRYKKQFSGLDDDSARMLATVRYEADQQLAQVQSTQMAQFQVPALVSQVCADPRLAPLANEIGAAIQAELSQGNLNALDPGFARAVGAQLWFERSTQQPGAIPPTPPIQPPAFGGQWTPVQGFAKPAASAPAKPPLTDQQQKWAKDFQSFIPKQ